MSFLKNEVIEENSFAKRDKRKPLSYCLEYVLHVGDCHRGKYDKQSVLDKFNICKSKVCEYAHLVTAHKSFTRCQLNKACDISSCYSSTKLFLHCKDCTISDCCICYLIKGGRNSAVEVRNKIKGFSTNLDFLDSKCGVYFEEKNTLGCTSEGTRTVETQTDDKENSLQSANQVHLPDGLVLEKIEFQAVDGSKNPELSVSSELRMTQIHGFIHTIIGKVEASVMLDQKMLYFLMYVTSIEDEVYQSTDSKEEYLKMLLGKICETNKEFKEFKKQLKSVSVQDSAVSYFKHKIIEMFGSDELKEIIFPGVLKIRIEDPPKPKGIIYRGTSIIKPSTRRWQKNISSAEREKEVLKLLKTDGPFFSHGLIVKLKRECERENLVFEFSGSKLCYIDYLFVEDRIPTKKDRWKKIEFNTGSEQKKIALENNKKPVEESAEEKIVKEKPNNGAVVEKDSINDVDDEIQFAPVFCYSHNLLLTYSVTKQLWNKSFEESDLI